MIEKLLVANRGEIAIRVFETAKSMGIGTVAVFSDPDRKATFVEAADEAVAIGGASPGESYLRAHAIIDAARSVGADAIHPGYGFLAESADFARAVIEAGLTWVGPSPEAIETMGSKLRSKALVSAAGVPTLPSVDVTSGSATDAADEIGYPVLIKASAGGGGKGMRIVRDRDQLEAAVAGAKREAGSAFGDETVFVEKYLIDPRHIEIQVFADHTGRTVSLFERECSIQRRHQKIVEESPSVAMTPTRREEMGEAAVSAAEAVGYVGAGTVEFLFDHERFWFLEMNTRLQVEHPVTEAVTGLDLVELQLLTAAGKKLPEAVWEPRIDGHAVEVRLYAEDPLNDYLPVTGTLRRFEVPTDVRLDSGVASGSQVSIHYDPMLAKVIAHGSARDTAGESLSHALRRSIVSGITTNRDLLIAILEHPEFVAGRIDTGFLDRHPPSELITPLLDPDSLREAAMVAALDLSDRRRLRAPVLTTIPSGWRNNPFAPQRVSFTTDTSSGPIEVAYRALGDGMYEITGDEGVDVVRFEPGAPARLERRGHVSHFEIEWSGDVAHVIGLRGAIDLTLRPRFGSADVEMDPGSLTSPMPGRILSVLVGPGDSVGKGDPLIVMEAMKMEHTLRSPVDGTVESVSAATGDQVEGDIVLVTVSGGLSDQPSQEGDRPARRIGS